MGKDSTLMRVSQNTQVSALASRILDQVRQSGYVTLETVGGVREILASGSFGTNVGITSA